MTNNDEMALKLKAAAKQRIDAESWYGVDGRIARIALHKDTAKSFSPENILALLAERDADKKRITELEAAIDANAEDRAEFAEELGCAGDNESVLEAIEELKERVRTAELSVSVLEARTVSVKLPPVSFFDFKAGSGFADGAYVNLEAMNKALRAAGINLEVGE